MNSCLICVVKIEIGVAGKLLNTCSDVAPNSFVGDIFKHIAGGESISTRQRYKDVATLTDYAKMIFCLNELPKSKIDPRLTEKIISTELSGIMNWVLDGRENT